MYVILQLSNVLQIVDIEENGDPRKEQAQLPFDRRALVLPGAPYVTPAHASYSIGRFVCVCRAVVTSVMGTASSTSDSTKRW